MSSSPHFYAVGQRWHCTGRDTGETPSLLINQIDSHPLGGEIFHITLYGVRIRNPALAGGLMTHFAHLPVTRHTLDVSVTGFEGAQAPDPAYREGYAQWKQAFDAHQAGAFGVSVAEILEIVERGINGTPQG
jgi:hypothetical protein